MAYAVLKVSNGVHTVVAEGIETKRRAKTLFHQNCAALWNAEDVVLASVSIVDDAGRLIDGYHEVIPDETATE